MAAGTSGTERALRVVRERLEFGTIIVVGGGCYGSYYVRQLGRAYAAGAIGWQSLVVTDRDAGCAVARLPEEERPAGLRVDVSEWSQFFERFLTNAAANAAQHATDAVVPSPLMPHLMAEWIVARARQRWPAREVRVAPLDSAPAVPWQRAGEDGTHYVSFAEWMCP